MCRRLCLFRKLLLILILPLVLSYLVLSVVAVNTLTGELIDQKWADEKNESSVIASRISALYRDVSNCAMYILFDFYSEGEDSELIPNSSDPAHRALQTEKLTAKLR